MYTRKSLSQLLLLTSAAFPLAALATTPPPASLEAMWEIIQQQKQEIEALKAQMSATDQKVEVTGERLEQVSAAAEPGKAGSDQTHIGGYGELHYNNLDNQKAGGADKNEIDFHRFVLFFGHDFNERLRFHSELELEHALVKDTDKNDGTGSTSTSPGEVELEQAYIEYDFNDMMSAKAGVFLLPVGIINETHEPPTFYGTERNPVESNIIPSTWWEGGAMLTSRFDNGISTDFAVHSGLKTSAGDSYAVRKGRQKVASAAAEDAAYTARVKWTGHPGLELAASFQHQTDITQSLDTTAGSANMVETHVAWNNGPFSARALYALWDLNGAGPKAVGADRQEGWYIEPSYKLTEALGVFTRYNRWDNKAGDSADSEYTQWDVGVNYWLSPDVVLKADYQNQSAPAGKDEYDGVNLGVGYQF